MAEVKHWRGTFVRFLEKRLFYRLRKTLGKWSRAHLPKSLYGRTALVIVLPMVLLQCVVLLIFMERHWETVTRRLSFALAREIGLLVFLFEQNEATTLSQNERREGSFPDTQHFLQEAARRLNLTVIWGPPVPLPQRSDPSFLYPLPRYLQQGLSENLRRPFWIDTQSEKAWIEIRIQFDDFVLHLRAPRNRASASNTHIFIVWMVIASVILIALALRVIRRQIRPIEALSKAAEAFGKGRQKWPLAIQGASEVRKATQAFLEMRQRITDDIQRQTLMLAGVSHDLKTLLTRLQLQVALLKDEEERAALQEDIGQMNRMLGAYLSFARQEGIGEEEKILTDLREVLENFILSLPRSSSAFPAISVELNSETPLRVPLQLLSFQRCMMNLLENAQDYGQKIQIRVFREPGFVCITIDDDGPGIPEESREAVFEPFLRLTQARGVEEGHTGLGLTIARDCARRQGGEIHLNSSPLGGVQALLRLPIENSAKEGKSEKIPKT